MQIVIDIDDKVYGLLRYFEKALGLNNKKDDSDDVKTALMRAVINGTPLPKGHGRLIDADAFITVMEDASKRQKYKELLIDDCLTVDDVFKAVIESLLNRGLAEGDAPTIIEANKIESENKECI